MKTSRIPFGSTPQVLLLLSVYGGTCWLSLLAQDSPPQTTSPAAQPNVAVVDTPLNGDFPPRKFDAGRYERIWTKNPFVAEVVAPDEAPPEEADWAKGLVLRAVNLIEGKYVVHVEDTSLAMEKDPHKARARFQRLVQDQPFNHPQGLNIVRVKAHRDPNQVEVTVARAADQGPNPQEAVVRYDPRALAAKAAPTPAVVNIQPTAPPQNTVTPQVILPPGIGETDAQAQAQAQIQAQAQGEQNQITTSGDQAQGAPDQADAQAVDEPRAPGRRDYRGRGNRANQDPGRRRVVLPPGVGGP